MIDHSDLYHLASTTLSTSDAITETEIRRSVSTLYYGLFHQLSSAVAAQFARGGERLTARVARALEHRTMLSVCETFAKWNKSKPQGVLGTLLPSKLDDRLIAVADTFVRLQEARFRADYDLTSDFKQQDALTLLEAASRTRLCLDEIADHAATVVFLTALLLGDRFSRRG